MVLIGPPTNAGAMARDGPLCHTHTHTLPCNNEGPHRTWGGGERGMNMKGGGGHW